MLKLACLTVVMVGKQFTFYLLRTGTEPVFPRPQLQFSQPRLGPCEREREHNLDWKRPLRYSCQERAPPYPGASQKEKKERIIISSPKPPLLWFSLMSLATAVNAWFSH